MAGTVLAGTSWLFFSCAALLMIGARDACGDEPSSPSDEHHGRFEWHVEAKMNVRSSSSQHVDLYPATHARPLGGGDEGVEQTPDPGTSLELSKLAVSGDAELTPDIHARVKVHFLDLYDRNPTSSDDRVFLREAWVQFGRRYDVLQPMPKGSLYLLAGKAPRFTKQLDRRLESYGLVGNAIGRFEQVQLQVGGSIGSHLYWRAHLATPNPLFYRDPNALAGDNGTPESETGPGTTTYGTGFVMLYDAKAADVNFSGQYETGIGVGFRSIRSDQARGIDVLGWYVHRKLAESVPIRGTEYRGDLALLESEGAPFPLVGEAKSEFGLNVKGKVQAFRLFAQAAHQSIAGLKRSGFELELAYLYPLPGLCASGDTPVVNWIQPAMRYSIITNDFDAPAGFPRPSVGWDWTKIDFGFRLGIIRGVDVTVEYSRHGMKLANGTVLHPDEFLATLRVSH